MHLTLYILYRYRVISILKIIIIQIYRILLYFSVVKKSPENQLSAVETLLHLAKYSFSPFRCNWLIAIDLPETATSWSIGDNKLAKTVASTMSDDDNVRTHMPRITILN